MTLAVWDHCGKHPLPVSDVWVGTDSKDITQSLTFLTLWMLTWKVAAVVKNPTRRTMLETLSPDWVTLLVCFLLAYIPYCSWNRWVIPVSRNPTLIESHYLQTEMVYSERTQTLHVINNMFWNACQCIQSTTCLWTYRKGYTTFGNKLSKWYVFLTQMTYKYEC